MGFVIYQGKLEELEGKPPFGDGECVALPQSVTNVGHTSAWRPGPRVVDLSYLNPGTVIANFVFDSKGVGRFPNKHRYHAALFWEFGERSMATGMPVRIWVADQWVGVLADRRHKLAFTPEDAKRKGVAPADNANEFYVVMV